MNVNIAEIRNDERAMAAGIAIVRRVMEDVIRRTNPKYATDATLLKGESHDQTFATQTAENDEATA